MWPQRDYLNDARKHEEVFRNILRSLSEGFDIRDVEDSLEDIFQKYSEGNRYGRWTILDFCRGPYDRVPTKLSDNEAILASENMIALSGSGRVSKYIVNDDKSVLFDSNISVWMS